MPNFEVVFLMQNLSFGQPMVALKILIVLTIIQTNYIHNEFHIYRRHSYGMHLQID